MEFSLLHILTFLSLSLVASNAALTSEVYWNSVLPNTRMPKAITDIIHPTEWAEEMSTSVSVQKGGVNVNTGKSKPGTQVNVGEGGVGVDTGKPGGRTNVGVGKGGVSVSTGKPGGRTNVGVGKGGISVSTGHQGKPVYVGVSPGLVPFLYLYAATEDQLKDNPNVALFFLEKDITPGTKMNLQFTKTTSASTFLPRQVADSIPFSSNKLPEILNQFSVKPNSAEARQVADSIPFPSKKLPEILNHFKVEPNSVEAEMMNKTVRECEEAGIVGEEKYCATSLESMLDFSISKLGKEVKAISTEVNETQLQKYSIVGATKMAADKAVVCHKQNYPYLVFYCHKTSNTKAYMVSLMGDDGTKGKAVAVCHKDTAAWNPKHLAFQVLKIKPGTVPICHFLPEGHVVWVPY